MPGPVQLTDEQLLAVSMDNDPFPILEMLNSSQGMGTNLLTVPGQGATAAPVPGSLPPFTGATGGMPPPAKSAAPSGLDSRLLSMILGAGAVPQRQASAVAPRGPSQVQLGPVAPPQQRTALPPSLAQILHGR